MIKFRIPAQPKVWIPFLVVFIVLLVIMPRTAKFNYDYKKGQTWKHETLVAEFDFPIYKTEEQMQAERSESSSQAIPYYRYSDELVNKNLRALEGMSLGSVKTTTVNALRTIFQQGIVPDEGVKVDKHANLSTDVLFIQKDKRAVKYPVTEVYKQADARAKLLAEVSKAYSRVNVDSLFRQAGVYDLVVPNLIYDKQTTELVSSESASQVSPTQGYVNAGQLIVSEGEIVTAEIEQILDSYKEEYENNMGYRGPDALFWLGNVLVALSLVFILFIVILFTYRRILPTPNVLCYVLFIFLLSTVSALAVGKYDNQYLYMVPFTLSGLYLQVFYKNRLIVPFYIISLLPLLIFTHAGAVLFVMFLVAGLTELYAFRFFGKGWRQFIAAMIAFIAILLTYLGFTLIDAVNTDIPRTILFLFIGSMLSIAFYPLIYLLEKVFNLVSTTRLEELANTSSMLLRRLEEKAPGTFQHTLQVTSMAEAAARAIDADVVLVRAGAMYHDVGKMKNPYCFIENESILPREEGFKPYHEGLSPQESARDIIKHVTDGLDLAVKYGLPDEVKAFIRSHHGTSCTSYFFNKYLNEGGDPAAKPDFTYPGMAPQTKEQIIVMLCDSIEAASRTLKENTPEAYSEFVERMVASKMNDGQFENADISIKELNTVKSVLKSYLAQMHHERITYPARKQIIKNSI